MKKRALHASYQIVELIRKHLDESITPAENSRLEHWLQAKEANRILFRQLAEKEHAGEAISRFKEIAAERAATFERISSQLTTLPSSRTRFFLFRHWSYAAAATVLLCLGAASLFYFNNSSGPTARPKPAVTVVTDIPPGGNKATLTLANGSVITLDSLQSGTLVRQGNAAVIQLGNGQLAYKKDAAARDAPVVYNIIATPRGGQYQLLLPDGSKAWLNAASSLRFPTAFTGGKRKVQLTGEGYFEVAPLYTGKKKTPFIVEIGPGGGQVEVLGTHFNVMAYDDESAVKVTLLTGAVKVSKGLAGARLTPGQQAQLDKAGQLKVQPQADVAAAMAWKNGMFQFHSADLPAVLRQLSRWYDVDVIYKGPVPSREFEGEIERNLTLSQVLRILEKNQVHIKIEGTQMVVMP
ncbi:DUF4974 domain-containing protein [Chitinophaga agrisoli]|uniref:DUF4974 domain-containing protein n=1 Tax=Chitinophaga agrisoli TaxID=2607653 RepID=A0A5B2VPZ4_9BACT|nr:FecR family protein [Chitinophaga agrisoli]KAA2241833.1 DUF4974 domain-containing protein [Chitinophaga agrisoli]